MLIAALRIKVQHARRQRGDMTGNPLPSCLLPVGLFHASSLTMSVSSLGARKLGNLSMIWSS